MRTNNTYMMTSTHPAPESFVNTSFPSQTTQRFVTLYLKPLALATATALLLAFLVAYSCLSLAAGVSAANHKNTRQNAAPDTEMSGKTAMHTSAASSAN
jgi:hypothetical protein